MVVIFFKMSVIPFTYQDLLDLLKYKENYKVLEKQVICLRAENELLMRSLIQKNKELLDQHNTIRELSGVICHLVKVDNKTNVPNKAVTPSQAMSEDFPSLAMNF